MNPRISVIVPIHNIKDYIEKCVCSILHQTYSNIEVILVDDGSDDGSERICDYYANYDVRVKVIHENNMGVTVARKNGLSIASGEYIGFVDGDDCVKPNMYQIMLEEALETGADFVNVGYIENGVRVGNSPKTFLCSQTERLELLKDALQYKRLMPSIWSKLYKATLIKEAFTFVNDTTVYGEDMVSLCAAIILSDSILLMDENLYEYTVRSESSSHGLGHDHLKREMELYNNLTHLFKEKNLYLEMEEALKHFFLNQMAIFIEKETRKDFVIQRFEFDRPEILLNKRIIIYGAGRVGRDYFAQISRYRICSIVAWIDKNRIEISDPYIKISMLEQIQALKYDMIILAVHSEKTGIEIKDDLIRAGIDADKIYWKEPKQIL